MLCKKCGAELPDGTEKCIFCGTTLAEELPAEENSENTAPKEDTVYDENERKRLEQIEKMIADKKQQLSEIEKRRNSKKQKEKRKKIIIAALITAILAVGAGVGAYYIKNIIDANSIEATASPIPSAVPSATETPEPTVTPDPGVTIAPSVSPEAQASAAPASGSQSWSATGNTGSGTAPSSSSTGTSSGKTSSNKTGSTSSKTSGGSSTSSGSQSSSSGTAAVKITDTGLSTKTVDSQLAKGGEVIYNQSTGRYLMTFTLDNTRYYANVSAGSTTEQIQGKYMTITAAPTGETYSGNTVYEISSLTDYVGNGYIIKDSGTRLLTNADIAGLSKEKLALARNEIYARHGRRFKMAIYRDYFNKCSWYSENPNYNYSDDNSNLNEIEIKNVELILKAENSK